MEIIVLPHDLSKIGLSHENLFTRHSFFCKELLVSPPVKYTPLIHIYKCKSFSQLRIMAIEQKGSHLF